MQRRLGSSNPDVSTKDVAWTIFKTLRGPLEVHRATEVLAVDIPIGLLDLGSRECDLVARKHLGPIRGRSVFPAPIRPMLGASSHQDACAIGRTIEGRGLTLQAWNIAPKISEVDQLLRESPGYRGVVREVHPRLASPF